MQQQNNTVDLVAPPPVEGVGGGGTGYGWSDGQEPQILGLGNEIDVTRHATSDLVHVWCMPSTAMIGHQEPPRPLQQVRSLSLSLVCVCASQQYNILKWKVIFVTLAVFSTHVIIVLYLYKGVWYRKICNRFELY